MKKLKICKSTLTVTAVLAVLFIFAGTTFGQDDFQSLIKEVQKNSQSFYNSISSATFTGRSKSYVYVDWPVIGLNLIPEYEEYVFEGHWMKPDSLRINIKAVRIVEPDTVQRTKVHNYGTLPNPFHFSYNSSALGEDRDTLKTKTGEKISKWPVFPFAEGADSIYSYRMSGKMSLNDKEIIAVSVKPKYSDVPAVIGSFMIDPVEKIVVGSDVIFNEAAEYGKKEIETEGKLAKYLIGDVTEDHQVKTKKALLYSSYWLPQTIEEELFAKIIGIKAKIYRIIEFDSYIINPEVPDTTEFRDKKITYKIDPAIDKELKKDQTGQLRLTKQEEDLIKGNVEKIFSSMNLSQDLFNSESIAKDAFNLRLGKKGGNYLQLARNLSDNVSYNRVEGLVLKYGATLVNPVINNFILNINGGYGLGNERPKGEAAAVLYSGEKKRLFFEGNIYSTTGYNEENRLITTGKNTLTTLIGHMDFRDYYYKKGGSFGIGWQQTNNLALKISAVSQKEESASNSAKFSIFKWEKPFRLNPDIAEGWYNGLNLKMLYRMNNINFDILAEYTDKDMLNSDFSFTNVKTVFSLKKDFNRKNIINLYLSAGISSGTLPPQRWFDFGGKTFVNYTGNLRGVGYKYFTGDRMINGVVDYTLYPADIFDFDRYNSRLGRIRKILKLNFWTGAGWSELSDRNIRAAANLLVPARTTDGLYHEFGIGISDRFNFCRLDFVINSIKKNTVKFSVNFLR